MILDRNSTVQEVMLSSLLGLHSLPVNIYDAPSGPYTTETKQAVIQKRQAQNPAFCSQNKAWKLLRYFSPSWEAEI